VLMAAVADALPKEGGAFVHDWEMIGNRLKITISSTAGNVVGANYVQALEKTGRFTGVQIISNADPKMISFSMTILETDRTDNDERRQ